MLATPNIRIATCSLEKSKGMKLTLGNSLPSYIYAEMKFKLRNKHKSGVTTWKDLLVRKVKFKVILLLQYKSNGEITFGVLCAVEGCSANLKLEIKLESMQKRLLGLEDLSRSSR